MRELVNFLGIDPILVDVGASEGPPSVWAPIAGSATYVGFDPDSREMANSVAGPYRRAVIVNEAVTGGSGAGEVRFYLARSPVCSSTLEPDTRALSNYHFFDLFTTERQVTVRAATLDAVLVRLGLDRIDWLKCDTQGTDLRIYRSLSESVRGGVLALDVEPGLIDCYRGEDLFVDSHKYLVANGYWLSRLDLGGAVRVRSSTLRTEFPDGGDPAALAEKSIRKSPGWCEARYLRTLESLGEAGAARERYALLCVFSLLDQQPGYALDVTLEYERRFGADEWSARLRAASMAALVSGRGFAATAKRWIRRLAGRLA